MNAPTPHPINAAPFDALVIGAGPAGALAALLLARQGRRVRLVERKAFPREKVCGACFNVRALSELKKAGLDDMLASLPGEPLGRVAFRGAGRMLSLPLPGGLAIARDQFDAALVDEAVKAGVEFLPETTAAVLPLSDDCPLRRVQLSTRHGGETVEARVVLAADGLGQSSLQQLSEFTSQVSPGSRIGLGATVAAFDDAYEPGTIHLAVGRAGYVGLVRLVDAKGRPALHAAVAVEADFVRDAGGPARAAGLLLKEAGAPAVAALADAAWHGTVPLTRRPSAVAGQRLFLLGDATGYIEPFTGEGIAWALGAAAAVAPLASRAIDAWNPELSFEWQRFCTRSLGAKQRWCRLLSSLVRRRWAVIPVMSLLSRFPGLARPLVERISGTPAFSSPSRS